MPTADQDHPKRNISERIQVPTSRHYGEDASNTTPANNPNVTTVSAIADTDGVCGGVGPIIPEDIAGEP